MPGSVVSHVSHVSAKPLVPRWLKHIFIALVAVSVLILVVVFAAIVALRSNTELLEVVLEKATTAVLNRELQIGELIEAELNWDSYLLARDVSLANPDWAGEPQFARVGLLRIRINLPSIWQDGPILIHELAINDARVTILAPESHAPNWDFWPDEGGDTRDDTLGGEVVLERVFPVLITNGSIDNGEIIYRDPDQDVRVSIARLSLEEPNEGALIELGLDGAINEIPVLALGHIGPMAAIIAGKDLQLDLDVNWGDLSVAARGSIADLATFSGPDLHLNIAAPESRPLLDMLGMSEVRGGPLQFEGNITDADPGLAVDAVGSLGEFGVQFSGSLVNPLALEGMEMDFKLNGPSLTEIGAMFDLSGLSEIPFEVSGEVRHMGTSLGLRRGRIRTGSGQMTVEGRLPNFPGIDDWELTLEGEGFDLSVLGPLIGVEDLPPLPVAITGALESSDEGVELVDLRMQSPNSSLILSGVVGEAPDYEESRIELTLSGKDLAVPGRWLGAHDLPNLAYDLSGQLSLDGKGWRLSNAKFITKGLQLALEGDVDKLPSPASVNARMEMSSPDLAATLRAYGFELDGLPAFPILVKGSVSGSPERLRLEEATAKSGASQLSAAGMLGDPLKLVDLDLELEFSTPDLFGLVPVKSEEPLPQVPANLRGKVSILPGGIGVKDLKGQIGGAAIALGGLLSTAASYEGSHIDLSAKGDDLGKLAGPWLKRDMAHSPFELQLKADFQSGGVTLESFDATVADTRMTANLVIGTLDDLSSAHGHIKIGGPSSLNLMQWLAVDSVIPDAEYAMDVEIQQTPDRLRLDPVKLIWGRSDYGGTVDIQPGAVPIINAALHSKYVSLPFLLPDLKQMEEEEQVREAEGGEGSTVLKVEPLTSTELKERVISDQPWDFNWMRQFQGTLAYRLDEMYLGPKASTSVNVDVSLADGVLSTRELRWDGTFSTGAADITLQALEEGAEVVLDLNFERVPLMFLLGGEPEDDVDSFYRAHVKARGNSLQAMARTANGALLFKGGGGRLDNNGLDLILGDTVEEVLNRLNPFSQTEPYTQLVCHAGAMSVKNGKMDIAPGIVMRTDKMDIASGGAIDLHKEQLNLAFNTKSRKGIGISASKAFTPYFKLGGTLANPRLALDVKGAAVSGGAAVATAGLSILAEGLWDRWIATAKNPCEGLITQLSKDKSEAYRSVLERQHE